MSTLADAFDELRGMFRDTTRTRLEEMLRYVDALEADPEDRDVMRKLARHFHGLAGLGTTYGYARISELGELGEMQMATGMMAFARWREIIGAVANEIEPEA
ncbi:MAG TPA: Hpt domain-containing protein [Thermoanaerobaculia bacterium]|nr:Hpt domain-containing protein [Thermoanaerobaculia bacterium]